MVEVESSNIKSIGYEGTTLRVLFKNKTGNKAYDYERVPPRLHEELMSSNSKGQFLNAHIKPVYNVNPVA
jgi:hypothetical protein